MNDFIKTFESIQKEIQIWNHSIIYWNQLVFFSTEWKKEISEILNTSDRIFKNIQDLEKKIKKDSTFKNQKKILKKEIEPILDYIIPSFHLNRIFQTRIDSLNLEEFIDNLLIRFSFDFILQKIRHFISEDFPDVPIWKIHKKVFEIVTRDFSSVQNPDSLMSLKKEILFKKNKIKLVLKQIKQIQKEQKKILQILKQNLLYLDLERDFHSYIPENLSKDLETISIQLAIRMDSSEVKEKIFQIQSERLLYLPEYSDQWIMEEFSNEEKYPDNFAILRRLDKFYHPGKKAISWDRKKIIEKILQKVKTAKGNKIHTAGKINEST